ncbi:MAG: hypothetical protein VX278_07590, partial [Myxococcota bacterium]|nr:hypothetical protein [Myxococcota bacterium]
NPLDDSIFASYPLWMELTVDGDPLEPRHPIQSVPYASVSGTAESVDGGTVNASEISINDFTVVDGDGNWMGTPINWNDLEDIPEDLFDGDADTQLTQADVLSYVDGSTVNLGSGSQVAGSDIVTADSFESYLASDLADGDNDSLGDLSCQSGEIASWDGSGSWLCASDATLTLADLEDLLQNNPIDLNANTTIGGASLVTTATDADTLASLSCQNDGEIAKYDGTSGSWYCDFDVDTDTDTVLSSSDVLAYVNGQALSLSTGTQVDGSHVVTEATFSSHLPSDIADGDADTQLSQSDVLSYVDGSTVNLGSGSQVAGSDIVTAGSFESYLASDLADGDNDSLAATPCGDDEILVYDLTNATWGCGTDQNSTLTASEVEEIVESASDIGLSGNLSVDGTATFNDSVTADQGLTVNGGLVNRTVYGPHGYIEFTTDVVQNTSTTATQTYTLLDMRCSGHWGSYFVEIDLVTYYYRPSVRRYEYYCGNGNHTSGGTLVEIQTPQAISSLVSLSKSSATDSGYDHSGIRMYDVKLEVSQGAYVRSYARVRSYGMWASRQAGTAFSTSAPFAVWQTWTE